MASLITVRVRASDVIEDIHELSGAIELANRSAVARIHEGLRSIVIGSLELAMQEAGEAFHPIYQRHLRQGIHQLDPEVFATNDGIVARYFDIEGLADYGDLEEGFHYHALLNIEDKKQFSVNNPQRVELPYRGQDLYNDFDQRYDFWKALVDGDDYDVTLGKGKSSHSITVSTAGLYEETLTARVNFWGNRYPEWLLLEYGTDFYPTIAPTHFKYYTEQRVQEYMTTIYEEILDSIVSVWQQPTVKQNSIGQLINEKGRFVKYLPDDIRGVK